MVTDSLLAFILPIMWLSVSWKELQIIRKLLTCLAACQRDLQIQRLLTVWEIDPTGEKMPIFSIKTLDNQRSNFTRIMLFLSNKWMRLNRRFNTTKADN